MKQKQEEEKEVAGKVIFYVGQVIQLIHFSTNMFLSANKPKRADFDPTFV